jgi:hypothetical protein
MALLIGRYSLAAIDEEYHALSYLRPATEL